jgi:hypothetical protein
MEDKTPGDPGLQECGNELEDRPCKAGKCNIMVEGGKFVWLWRTEDVRRQILWSTPLV